MSQSRGDIAFSREQQPISPPGGKDFSMKRVISFATTGLFVTGLALLPMTGRADQTVTGDKSVTPGPASATGIKGNSTTATAVEPVTSPVKKDDKKVTVTPSGAAPASGGAAAKTPAKGAS